MEQSPHTAVYSVLRNILEDEVDPNEIQQIDDEPRTQKGALSRLKDDLINLASLQKWFMHNLVVSDEHNMSMKEIWRHFCYDNGVYCSLALFGNLVYRHVFTQSDYWEGVTRVGETNNKKYNLNWSDDRVPVTSEKIDEFFVQITEEKEKREKRADNDTGVSRKAKNPVKIQPEMLVNWWNSRLELSDSEECSMKMREIWLKFTKETGIHISLALFGELSVRYVMRSNPNFAGVVRTRGIHDKKYSLRWKPLIPSPMYHHYHHHHRVPGAAAPAPAGPGGMPLSPPRSPRLPLAHAAAGHPHMAPPTSPPPMRHPQHQQQAAHHAAHQYPQYSSQHAGHGQQQQQHSYQHAHGHAHQHQQQQQHAAQHSSYASAFQSFDEDDEAADDDDVEVDDGYAPINPRTAAAFATTAPAASAAAPTVPAPSPTYQYPQFTLFGNHMDGLANSFSTVSIAS